MSADVDATLEAEIAQHRRVLEPAAALAKTVPTVAASVAMPIAAPAPAMAVAAGAPIVNGSASGAAVRYCTNCGSKLEAHHKFCATCGTPVVA